MHGYRAAAAWVAQRRSRFAAPARPRPPATWWADAAMLVSIEEPRSATSPVGGDARPSPRHEATDPGATCHASIMSLAPASPRGPARTGGLPARMRAAVITRHGGPDVI